MYKVLFDAETARQISIQRAIMRHADEKMCLMSDAFLAGKGIGSKGAQLLTDSSGVVYPHLNEDGTPKKSNPKGNSKPPKKKKGG